MARPEVIRLLRTGRPGRPRKSIDPKYLANALSSNRLISISRIARTLGISRDLVYKHMRTHNITRNYSAVTNAQLDVMLKAYRQYRPDSGRSYVAGFLRKHGLRVQRQRIIDSMHRIDKAGRFLRKYKTIRRRYYRVSRPNYLWHLDGHHKLIKYGFVIHGIIDGYCRTVGVSG